MIRIHKTFTNNTNMINTTHSRISSPLLILARSSFSLSFLRCFSSVSSKPRPSSSTLKFHSSPRVLHSNSSRLHRRPLSAAPPCSWRFPSTLRISSRHRCSAATLNAINIDANQQQTAQIVQRITESHAPASSPSSSSPSSLFSSLFHSSLFPSFPIGLLAGAVGSMSGIGGAVVLVPAVGAFMKYDPKHAAAIGVLGSAVTALTGFLTYAANNCVHVPLALCICAGASVTIGIGAKLASRMNNRTLQWILALVFLGLAPLVVYGVHTRTQLLKRQEAAEAEGTFKPEPVHGESSHPALFTHLISLLPFDVEHFRYLGPSPLQSDYWPYLAMLVGGGGLGFINGLLGMGGATSLTTALTITSDYHQLPYAAIAGTCLTAIIVPSFLGSYKHYKLGNLKTKNLPGLIAGTVAGALIGAEAAIHLPEGLVRSIFASFLFLTGARSVVTLMKKPKNIIQSVNQK